MASSGSGPGNPMYLSQGGVPMPGLPIAGQGAPNDNPRNFGQFQNFLPDAPAVAGTAPSARGLTAAMMQFKSPQGVAAAAPAAVAAAPAAPAAAAGGDLRTQLADAMASGGGFGGGGNGQFGAARPDGFYDWQFTGAHGVPLAPRPAGWG
jgi:hypothetical protein